MLAYYESAVQGKGAWGRDIKIIYDVQINKHELIKCISNNVLFIMLRCKQEWTCSCMSTATLIMKTEISCIATFWVKLLKL